MIVGCAAGEKAAGGLVGLWWPVEPSIEALSEHIRTKQGSCATSAHAASGYPDDARKPTIIAGPNYVAGFRAGNGDRCVHRQWGERA